MFTDRHSDDCYYVYRTDKWLHRWWSSQWYHGTIWCWPWYSLRPCGWV
jgi:hypothetical protein